MSNDSSGTRTNQDFDSYTIVVAAEYLPGKALITALSEPFRTYGEAKESLDHLLVHFPQASIRAERWFA